jgi:hypothetical protein
MTELFYLILFNLCATVVPTWPRLTLASHSCHSKAIAPTLIRGRAIDGGRGLLEQNGELKAEGMRETVSIEGD